MNPLRINNLGEIIADCPTMAARPGDAANVIRASDPQREVNTMKADRHSMPVDEPVCKFVPKDASEPTKATLTDAIIHAASERRRAALRECMLALQSAIVVGEDLHTIAHDHRQFYLCGLDVLDRGRA